MNFHKVKTYVILFHTPKNDRFIKTLKDVFETFLIFIKEKLALQHTHQITVVILV